MKYNKNTIKNTKPGAGYTFLLLAMAGILIITSCTDMQTDTQFTERKQDLTPKQTQLRDKLKDTALLMKQVVVQPDALRELRYAINFYTKNRNADERVSFAALFDEEAAYKVPWRKAKVADVKTSFVEAFREVAQKRKGTSFDLEEFLNEENIEVYFPYSEYWEGQEIIPTLTYHPIDNEDVNEGWEPVISKAKTMVNSIGTSVEDWNEVTVDDDYAYKNETMIILPPEDGGGGSGGSGSGNDNTYFVDVDPDENTTPQVKLGYFKLEEQLDGLFRGGTDIRIKFVDVVEIEPGKIAANDVPIEKDLSRADVREKRWITMFQIADYRWHEYQNTLPMVIYDHDGDAGEDTITFHYQVKDANGNYVEINSEHKISDKWDHIGTFLFDRELFLVDNKNDGGWGLKGDHQIYKANHDFYFTVPHRIINLN